MTLNDDFDGDGRSEIAVVTSVAFGILQHSLDSLDVQVMATNGSGFDGWLLNTQESVFHLAGDLNGDGCGEILASDVRGIGALRQAGGSMSVVMTAPNGTRFDGWLLNTADNRFGPIGDFDGDRLPEILIASPWGIGILKLSGATFRVLMMAPNGTRFGGWLLNTADNRFGPVADLDGDGCAEIIVSSPWGVGVLKLSGSSLTVPMMAPNGTRFGGWWLNTGDNTFGELADYDADGRPELLVTSPWGLGLWKFSDGTCNAFMMMPNGTRLGGWLLNTADNVFGPVADYDGDRRSEVLVTSPWGIGVLAIEGGSLTSMSMSPNGSLLGKWKLNTAENQFLGCGDYDGDGRQEIVVTNGQAVGLLRMQDKALAADAVLEWHDRKLASLLPGS